MTVSTSANIKRALVVALRANTTLKNQITGFFEGFAPPTTKYPFVVYNIVYAPYDFAWGSVMIESAFDVYVFGENSVEANNLDALVLGTLHNATLSVDSQSTLVCRRVGDISSQDMDDEGKKIYQIGGTYEIWTDQSDT